MASKLGIYNQALEHLKERHLASLTEEREPRRKLDFAWDDGVKYCLEQGLWNFAMRSVQLNKSETITPSFGYQYAILKPTDWVRTVAMSGSGNFDDGFPLNDFSDETDYWGVNIDPLYVRYVSNAPEYGLNLARWPETFTTFVAAYLAFRICSTSGSSELRAEVERRYERYRVDARSKDAMNQPAGRPPRSSWVTSRGGGNPERG